MIIIVTIVDCGCIVLLSSGRKTIGRFYLCCKTIGRFYLSMSSSSAAPLSPGLAAILRDTGTDVATVRRLGLRTTAMLSDSIDFEEAQENGVFAAWLKADKVQVALAKARARLRASAAVVVPRRAASSERQRVVRELNAERLAPPPDRAGLSHALSITGGMTAVLQLEN